MSADLSLFEVFLEENGLISKYTDILIRPDTFVGDDSLVSLDLSNLDLDYLPDGVTHLTSLERLILRDNHIKELPNSLSEMPNLIYLDMTGNPVKTLPPLYNGTEVVGIEGDVEITYMEPVAPTRARVQPLSKITGTNPNVFSLATTEYIRRVLIERRCCSLSGRLGDRYCQMCGRVIPEEKRVHPQ